MSLCPTFWDAVLWLTKLSYLAADATISCPFAALLGSNTHLDSTLKSRSTEVLRSDRANAVKKGPALGIRLSHDDLELQLYFLPFF